MKAIVLAAGYGTRLYPLTIDKPKALLDVAGKTILERILEKVFLVKGCDACYIVTNAKFYRGFSEWLKTPAALGLTKGRPIDVINDGTSSNETRLGAIGDIYLAIKDKKINDDVLVLGSDNIFDFNMKGFVEFASSKRPSASLALYDILDIKKASLYGIASVDAKTGQVMDFQEKPKEPKSTLAATAIYYYPREKMRDFDDYMASSLTKDAPGNLIKWLSAKEKVFGYVFNEKWYDIGDIASYE